MFRRILSPACLALCVLTAGLTQASPAHATQYGSFVLHNPSNTDIHYAVAWGDHEWKVFTVNAGEKNAHYYELDENGEIPGPTITFDCKGGDGDDQLTLLSYDLDAFTVRDPMDGKDYSFDYSSDGRFIDLYAD